MTTETIKTTRAGQIAECIEIVARYYAVSPDRVLKSFAPKCNQTVKARTLVWYHMHKCGMSFGTIGRIFGGLSVGNVQRRAKYGTLALSDEDRMLLATLPRIETTIQITSK